MMTSTTKVTMSSVIPTNQPTAACMLQLNFVFLGKLYFLYSFQVYCYSSNCWWWCWFAPYTCSRDCFCCSASMFHQTKKSQN